MFSEVIYLSPFALGSNAYVLEWQRVLENYLQLDLGRRMLLEKDVVATHRLSGAT